MPEYYWTLVVESGWVQAAIWTALTQEKKASVVATGNPVAWSSDEDFISSIDAALSSLVQELPEGSLEPTKTVFGVPASVVEAGQIKPEWLTKIKLACTKLSLEPSGFVVLPEAIAYYTKQKEDSPLSGVIVGMSRENIDLSLFRLGNLSGSVSVSRSVSVVDDVVEGITRFHQTENLPSRFLLYDGREGELEEVRQLLVATDWETKNVKFLHLPKVEIIDTQEKIIAVCLAGAAEITGAVEVEVLHKQSDEERAEENLTDLGLVNLSNVESATVAPEELGFAVGRDVSVSPPPQVEMPHREIPVAIPMDKGGWGIFSAKVKFWVNKQLQKFFPSTGPKIGHQPVMGDALLYGIAAISLAVILGFAAWWFLPKAEVTIYVAPKKITKSETITVDTKNQRTDLAAGVLAGRVVTATVEGEKTTSATGNKTVGEKAKGKIQIRNGTSTSVKLAAGTALVSSNDLKFTLDSSASISAATSPTQPGTAIVDVTAVAIGPESNLAKGETFKVGNYPKSDVDGVAEISFTGGTSREITAVSEADRGKLEEELTNELKENGQTKVADSVSATDVFLPGAISFEETKKNFSAKVGDEAANVTLSMTLSVSGVAVLREDINNLAQEIFKNEIPSGFSLKSDQLEVEYKLIEEKNGLWKMEAIYTANLLPGVDTNEVAQKIKGKYPTMALSYLNSVPGFVRAEIKIKPSLPGKLGSLPRVAKNITIEIASEK